MLEKLLARVDNLLHGVLVGSGQVCGVKNSFDGVESLNVFFPRGKQDKVMLGR